MSKRRLSNTYKDLVDYIESENKSLPDFLTEVIEEGCKKFPNRDNKLWRIIEGLYITPLEDFELGELTKTIVDIYNDNYELEELKYYWKLNINNDLCSQNYYAYKYHYVSPLIRIDSNKNGVGRFTKTEFNNLLSRTQTNLTIDNFTPVEEIENE